MTKSMGKENTEETVRRKEYQWAMGKKDKQRIESPVQRFRHNNNNKETTTSMIGAYMENGRRQDSNTFKVCKLEENEGEGGQMGR